MAHRATRSGEVKVQEDDGEQPLERCFIHYSPPPSITADGNFVLGAKEDWLERIEFFIADTTWLLELNQKEFWDQMISNEKAMLAVISFLQEATPQYMLDTFPVDEEMWKMFQKAQFLVYLIFNRLTMSVESDNDIVTTDNLGKMLYNNYLITIPIILDLCLIYGQSNRAQISTIVNKIFEIQPDYTEDLIKAVPFFSKVLRNVERNFVGADKALYNGEPAKLSERGGVSTLIALQDCIFHVLDTATNLSIFLDIYTPACHILHEQLFENSMVTFYENTLPAMYERLEQVGNTPHTQLIYADLRHKLDVARVEMLKIFRLILFSIVNRVGEQPSAMGERETKGLAEDYVNVLTAALAEKTFIQDYHTAYPVDLDLDVLSQLCPEMDALKCNYILEAVLACFETPPPRNAGAEARDARPSSSTSSATAATMSSKSTAVVSPMIMKPTKPARGVELESLISQVKDILPHLGDGFVLSCLEHFEYASDAVINAVLEDALPGNLKAMDFSMPRTIEPLSEEDELAKGLQRLNVFDNDEFDIMTQDVVDMSRIHLGKKRDEHRDLAAMLDDKRHVRENRDTYTKLGLVDANADTCLYDDEYDDTYDHIDVSVAEAGEAERRPFVVPLVLRTQEPESSSEEEVGAPSGAAGADVRPRPGAFVPFAQNPEELRAKAEERRLAKRGGGRGGHRGGDVVGVAKGHGQEKNVTISRERKTQRGNQSRRSGAARKRNQGMIPS